LLRGELIATDLDRFVRGVGRLLRGLALEELLVRHDRFGTVPELHLNLTDGVEEVGLGIERVRRLELGERDVELLLLVRLRRGLDVRLGVLLVFGARPGAGRERNRAQRGDEQQVLHVITSWSGTTSSDPKPVSSPVVAWAWWWWTSAC
jgi:hypothetical protein